MSRDAAQEVLTRENVHGREGGVWSYVSPSRLNLWLKCPLAFKLKYLEGLEMPISAAQFVGRQVHNALEDFYRHRQLGLRLDVPELVTRLEESWKESIEADGMRFERDEDERAAWKQVVGLVAAYFAEVPADEPKPLAVETAVDAPLVDPANDEDLGLPLVGIVDLVLDEPAGPVITDFKTTARGGELAEIIHEVQLSCYAYLFRHATERVEGALEIRNLVKTKTPKLEVHRFAARTDSHFRRLFAVIRAYLADLETQRFVFRPGLTCSSCDFRETHCRAWTG